jgi:hypothetical protein
MIQGIGFAPPVLPYRGSDNANSGDRMRWKFTTQKCGKNWHAPIQTQPRSQNHCDEVLVDGFVSGGEVGSPMTATDRAHRRVLTGC